jgi:hypothetical protein
MGGIVSGAPVFAGIPVNVHVCTTDRIAYRLGVFFNILVDHYFFNHPGAFANDRLFRRFRKLNGFACSGLELSRCCRAVNRATLDPDRFLA